MKINAKVGAISLAIGIVLGCVSMPARRRHLQLV